MLLRRKEKILFCRFAKKDRPAGIKNCEKITHNSLIAINLGFEKLNLEGVGYLVPTKENSKISGVLFDSCSFPHLRNSVSIMGKPGYSVDEMVETFRLQTGVKQPHIFMNVNRCEEALPQKNVGHFKIVQNTEKNSPDWLSVSGQSFYPSGIPNCVITAKELAEKLFRSGKLKLFSAK